MDTLVRFSLPDKADAETVEADMALAIFAAECVYGRPRVRMEASYLVDEGGKVCVVQVSGAAGEAAVRVFTGLAGVRFGEDGFSVRRLERPREPEHSPQAVTT